LFGDRDSERLGEYPVVPHPTLGSLGYGSVTIPDTDSQIYSMDTYSVYAFWCDPTGDTNVGTIGKVILLSGGSGYTRNPVVLVDNTGTEGSGLEVTTEVKGGFSGVQKDNDGYVWLFDWGSNNTWTDSELIKVSADSNNEIAVVKVTWDKVGIKEVQSDFGMVSIGKYSVSKIEVTYRGSGYTIIAPPTIEVGTVHKTDWFMGTPGTDPLKIPGVNPDDIPPDVTTEFSVIPGVYNGSVTKLNVVNHGTGYKTPPKVTIVNADGDNSGKGASATTFIASRGLVKISETPSSITLR
jgi:hypothetical protein